MTNQYTCFLFSCLGQCIINENNDTQACESGTCSTAHTMNEIERTCEETIFRDITTLVVGTKFSINKNEENHQQKFNITESIHNFFYTCQSNNCNDNKTDEQIKQALKNRYNLSSFHQIINKKFKQEYLEELTTLSTTINFTTSIIFSNSSFITNKQIHNYSISNIILVYGLILTFFIRFF